MVRSPRWPRGPANTSPNGGRSWSWPGPGERRTVAGHGQRVQGRGAARPTLRLAPCQRAGPEVRQGRVGQPGPRDLGVQPGRRISPRRRALRAPPFPRSSGPGVSSQPPADQPDHRITRTDRTGPDGGRSRYCGYRSASRRRATPASSSVGPTTLARPSARAHQSSSQSSR
jgi:hypothetical protein